MNDTSCDDLPAAASPKIRPWHLDRDATVYVRQSTCPGPLVLETAARPTRSERHRDLCLRSPTSTVINECSDIRTIRRIPSAPTSPTENGHYCELCEPFPRCPPDIRPIHPVRPVVRPPDGTASIVASRRVLAVLSAPSGQLVGQSLEVGEHGLVPVLGAVLRKELDHLRQDILPCFPPPCCCRTAPGSPGGPPVGGRRGASTPWPPRSALTGHRARAGRTAT